jgi:hypothetical protein
LWQIDQAKIKNRKAKFYLNIAAASDRNVIQMEAEKKLKCKNFGIDIQRIRNMQCCVTLVVNAAAGIVTKGLNIW